VRFGDGLHDREPEPAAATTACGVGASEAVERPRQKLRREPVATVSNVELDPHVVACGLQSDLVAAVAERVIDKVAKRLLETLRVEVVERPVGGRRPKRLSRLL